MHSLQVTNSFQRKQDLKEEDVTNALLTRKQHKYKV